jgi:hypothetical protein
VRADEVIGNPIDTGGSGRSGRDLLRSSVAAGARTLSDSFPDDSAGNSGRDSGVESILRAEWPSAQRFARLVYPASDDAERRLHDAFAHWMTQRPRPENVGVVVRRRLVEVLQSVEHQRGTTGFDALPLNERIGFALSYVDGYRDSEAAHVLGNVPGSASDTAYGDTANDVADRLGLLPISAHDLSSIRSRAERLERRRTRRHQLRGLIAVVCVALVAIGAINISERLHRPTYDSIGNGPMRLMPTWLPPGVESMSPSAMNTGADSSTQAKRPRFQVGIWSASGRSVTLNMGTSEVGLVSQNDAVPLDTAIANGPRSDDTTDNVVLIWQPRTIPSSMAMLITPKGTPWPTIAAIARSVSVRKDGRAFAVSSLPLGLPEVFRGDIGELIPGEGYFYNSAGEGGFGGMSLFASRSSVKSKMVQDAMADPAEVPVRVRGRMGRALTGKEGNTVRVNDGEWTIQAQSSKLPVASLIRIINGLRQTTKEDWARALTGLASPSADTLAAQRQPDRTVATGTSFGVEWTVSAAQRATEKGCLNVRFVAVNRQESNVYIPIADKQVMFGPEIIDIGGGHRVAVIATNASVDLVTGTNKIALVPHWVVVSAKDTYVGLGITIVDVEDKKPFTFSLSTKAT